MRVAVLTRSGDPPGFEHLGSIGAEGPCRFDAYVSRSPRAAFSQVDGCGPDGSLAALLSGWSGSDENLRQRHANVSQTFKAERILAPVVDRAKILIAGARRDPGPPSLDKPITAMLKFKSAFADPDSIAALPDVTESWDVDAVLGVVLGKSAFRASREQAQDCIAGFTLIADVTDRARCDVEARTNNGLLAKNHRGLSSIGPCIWLPDATSADLGPIELLVNGDVKQRFTLADLAWSAADVIATWSAAKLFPGDVIGLGPGILRVGPGAMPPCPIKPGDSIEVRCGEIGSLRLAFASHYEGRA